MKKKKTRFIVAKLKKKKINLIPNTMKTFTFTLIEPNSGFTGTLSQKALSYKEAVKEATSKAKRFNKTLVL